MCWEERIGPPGGPQRPQGTRIKSTLETPWEASRGEEARAPGCRDSLPVRIRRLLGSFWDGQPCPIPVLKRDFQMPGRNRDTAKARVLAEGARSSGVKSWARPRPPWVPAAPHKRGSTRSVMWRVTGSQARAGSGSELQSPGLVTGRRRECPPAAHTPLLLVR